MNLGKVICKFLLFPFFFASVDCHSQDSLKASVLDKALKAAWPSRYDGRRDIINDTVTHYMYYANSNRFFGIIEYPKYNKDKVNYTYFFDSTGLRKVTVYRGGGLFKKAIYANYYFENNRLLYKKSHGLPLDQEVFLQNRGIYFFQHAAERFKGPKGY